MTQDEYPVLTIRQAKWVARLYRIQRNIHHLYFTALLYSNYEVVSEISKTPLDTTKLDQVLFHWPDFSDLIDDYSKASQSYENLSKASKRAFKPSQQNKGGKE
jgi:hypothetical protein